MNISAFKSILLKSAILVFLFVLLPLLSGSQPQIDTQKQNTFSSSQRALPIYEEVVEKKLQRFDTSYTLKEIQKGIIPLAMAGAEYDFANAYIAVDYDTGQILFEKNSQEAVKIASLTKLMTAVVALDLAEPEEFFMVREYAASQIPTKIGIVVGEKMSLYELLHASLLTSANDATEMIREGIDEKYGEQVFINAMNSKAKYLGLTATSFDNPQGFDGPDNYSSARDLAVLSHYALTNYQLIADIVNKDYAYLPEDTNHKQFDLYNWNGLLGVYPNVKGIKIGNTPRAGTTTLVLSEREGRKVLAVLLGAPDVYERDLWTAQLLDDSYKQLLDLEPVGLTRDDLYYKYSSWNY